MLIYIGCYVVTMILVYLMLRKPIENGSLSELKVRPWGFIAKFKDRCDRPPPERTRELILSAFDPCENEGANRGLQVPDS
jgi:hypothetical protein